MDKQLREQIRHDTFVEKTGAAIEYVKEHQSETRKYGIIALAVLVVGGGIWGYVSSQASARQDDLRKASQVMEAFIGDSSPTGGMVFKTQAEKEVAAIKAYQEVTAKHAGSKEAQLAYLSIGQLNCDQGKEAECEKGFSEATKGPDRDVASLGKLSMAVLYLAQGKNPDAEKLLRELMAAPSVTVSKEQAQIALARAITKSKPQEARLLLESLSALDRPAVTRAAVGALGELTGTGPQ